VISFARGAADSAPDDCSAPIARKLPQGQRATVGACVMGALGDGMVMTCVAEFWHMVIKGAVIVAAVILDQ
jgi:hypothetical protein